MHMHTHAHTHTHTHTHTHAQTHTHTSKGTYTSGTEAWLLITRALVVLPARKVTELHVINNHVINNHTPHDSCDNSPRPYLIVKELYE